MTSDVGKDQAGAQYPVAMNGDALVWATDLAEAGERPGGLLCVGCLNPVVLRAGARNRPHFAHLAGGDCAGGETVLHRVAIRVLDQAIHDASHDGGRYEVHCGCGRCLASRTANLARRSIATRLDQVIADRVRPDIAVHVHDRPFAVIEVIVTHAPELDALNVYEQIEVPVIRVWPTWQTLHMLRSGLPEAHARSRTQPDGLFDVVGTCRFPRHRQGLQPCETCGRPARRLSIETSVSPCYRCQRPFNVLDVIDCTDDELVLIAASCSELPDLTEFARERDVRLKDAEPRAAGSRYLMHHCRHCGRSQGDNFIYAQRGAATDVTKPATSILVCDQGHMTHSADIDWPPGSNASRPRRAIGLVGEPAGLFRPKRRADTSATYVASTDIGQITRRMLGLDH
ncbi:MAG TPA: competence protein CoiA family protein [Ilumatobacter sp.]|nr:competence protein CoiA family protein [Ilumatobacter sp.]